MPVRLCLDVNVWVAYYLANARGVAAVSSSCALAAAVFNGTCRLGPVQLIVSHAMLDTLELVLRRIPVTAPLADMARDQVEAAAGSGYLAQPPLMVLCGTAANAMLDQEDASVPNTAMAGAADLLATNSIADFIRGPRARLTTTLLVAGDTAPDAFRIDHPRLPDGLIVAPPARAAGWLVRGEVLPAAILARLSW